jgi:hypothetical protein
VADILLVEMATEKRSADTASDSADRSAKDCVTNQSTTDAACDCADGTVAAAAAMA